MRILRENFASLIVWLTAFEKVRAVHGKPRWDIAKIFLCEKDWLNALMAPPVKVSDQATAAQVAADGASISNASGAG